MAILLLALAGMTLCVPYILGQAVDDYLVGDSAAGLTEDIRSKGVRWTGALLLGIGLVGIAGRRWV